MDDSPAKNDAARQAEDCRLKTEGRRSAVDHSSFSLKPSDFSFFVRVCDLFTITLWEPWASLMALEQKRIETRSWPIPERLMRTRKPWLLVIHAGNRWKRDQYEQCLRHPFVDFLGEAWWHTSPAGPKPKTLGKALAVVAPIACERTSPMSRKLRDFLDFRAGMCERDFGDFRPGRFAWLTKFVCGLDPPVPMRGQQGLKRVGRECAAVIRSRLPEVIRVNV